MGYTSETAITIENEAFREMIVKAKAECTEAFEFIKSASIYRTDKFTTLHFDWVKWYEDYEDVKFIEDFIRDIPYVFRRIGEEWDDIDSHEGEGTDYDMYDCIQTIRRLDLDGAGEIIMIDEEGGETDGYLRQAG